MNSQNQAEAYYKQMSLKNVEALKNFLDEDVEFYGPLAYLKGKDAVLAATSNFMKMFKSLTIKETFGKDDQAVIVYSVDVPGISEEVPSTSWMCFKNGLITRIQLFYDASPFQVKKEEIFSKQ